MISGRSSEACDLVEENQFETFDQLIIVIEEVIDPIKRNEKLKNQKIPYSECGFNKNLCDVIEKAHKEV